MDMNLVNFIIANLPNFVGLILALMVANEARKSEKERADRLLEHFIECQDDRVRETPHSTE